MKDNSVMPVASLGRRAAAYWFVDGLPDIVLGMTLLLFSALGLWWCLQMRRPARRTQIDFLFIVAGVLFFYWKGRQAVDFLKSRLTYLRTGYVQPPEDVWASASSAGLISLSLRPGPPPDENVTQFNKRTVYVLQTWCFLFLGQYPWRHWYALLAMPVLAAVLYALNRKSEHPYRWWSTLILALSGPTLVWLGVAPILQPLLMPLLAAVWLIVQGACTLAGYLRANPYPRAPEGVRA
jgi:hypothetical protein